MSESSGGSAADIIAGFDAILPEQERVLEQAAQNVKLGLERDSEIYRRFTQLQHEIGRLLVQDRIEGSAIGQEQEPQRLAGRKAGPAIVQPFYFDGTQ